MTSMTFCNSLVLSIYLSFEIMFIRLDQKKRGNGSASLAIPTLFLVWPDELDTKDTDMVFYSLVLFSNVIHKNTAIICQKYEELRSFCIAKASHSVLAKYNTAIKFVSSVTLNNPRRMSLLS